MIKSIYYLKGTLFLFSFLLFNAQYLNAQKSNWVVSAGVNVSANESGESASFYSESFREIYVDDDITVREIYPYTFSFSTQLKTNIGYYFNLEHFSKLSEKFSISLGVGLTYSRFNESSSFQGGSTANQSPIRVDTLLNQNLPVFTNPCRSYTNPELINEGVDPKAYYQTLDLNVPINLYYQLNDRFRILGGLMIRTPLYKNSERAFLSTKIVDAQNGICMYERGKSVANYNQVARDFKLDLQLGATISITNRINGQLHFQKGLFTEYKSLGQASNAVHAFKLDRISAGLSYAL